MQERPMDKERERAKSGESLREKRERERKREGKEKREEKRGREVNQLFLSVAILASTQTDGQKNGNAQKIIKIPDDFYYTKKTFFRAVIFAVFFSPPAFNESGRLRDVRSVRLCLSGQ